jgi:hypothetical protein
MRPTRLKRELGIAVYAEALEDDQYCPRNTRLAGG